MALGFDHVTLAVTDLEEAKRFLAVLGFEEEKAVVAQGETIASYMGIPDWVSDHVTLVLQGVESRQEIQLLRFHHPPLEQDAGSGVLSRSGFNHICFRVESLEAALAGFAALGVRPRNRVMDFHDRKLVFLDGPAGVVVELAEWNIPPPPPRRTG
jgi:catechol 2,3-dioxygenase-like lactoylglutathione lyase family enzyme